MYKLKSFAGGLIGGLLTEFLGQFPEGFFADLIMGLVARLMDCDAPSDGADAQATVARHYLGEGRYDRRFFGRVARNVRQEARRRGESLTRRQSHAVAQQVLDGVRGADVSALSEVVFEHRARVMREVIGIKAIAKEVVARSYD